VEEEEEASAVVVVFMAEEHSIAAVDFISRLRLTVGTPVSSAPHRGEAESASESVGIP
jgi:hypothetical protein